jgi:hypothetical protein
VNHVVQGIVNAVETKETEAETWKRRLDKAAALDKVLRLLRATKRDAGLGILSSHLAAYIDVKVPDNYRVQNYVYCRSDRMPLLCNLQTISESGFKMRKRQLTPDAYEVYILLDDSDSLVDQDRSQRIRGFATTPMAVSLDATNE